MTTAHEKPDQTRAHLAKHVHRGLDRILAEQGFSAEAVAGLLDFDAQMFRWRSLQNKGEFITLLTAKLDLEIETGAVMGLLAVSRLTIGLEGGKPAPPTIGEVADEMKLDPSRASRIVAELVDKGFLRREADQSDGRRSVLLLTQKGIAMMEDFRQAKWQVMSELFNTWKDEEISAFALLLGKYLDGLSKVGLR